jgi:hypothetical protein
LFFGYIICYAALAPRTRALFILFSAAARHEAST